MKCLIWKKFSVIVSSNFIYTNLIMKCAGKISDLIPREVADGGEGEGDGGVHVGAGDVADSVDHDGDDETARDGGSEPRNLVFIDTT